MKAYIITEGQMEDLKRRLDLARFLRTEPSYNPEDKTPGQIVADIHRWMIYHLHVWLNEVSK